MMRSARTLFAGAFALVACMTSSGSAAYAQAKSSASGIAPKAPRVLIETDAGPITVEVYPNRAPVSATNFLRYVRDARYDGGAFYRAVTMSNQPRDSVRIEVIQGGMDRIQGRSYGAIAHETTEQTGLKHTDGVLSMARGRPGSASTEFFVVIGDQPSLDYGGKRNPDGQGFATFGRVIRGMEVVRAIQRMPSDSAPPQRLVQPVQIRSMRVVER